MAEKLAHGYLHRYKRPYGKSFLDAYMHKECYKKIHSSSRNQQRSENRLSYQPQMIPPVEISPHRTRSQSGLNRSDQDASIVDLLSTPLNIPAATTNPNVELSARSCLFRPCIERVSFLENLNEEYSVDFISVASGTSGILQQTKYSM